MNLRYDPLNRLKEIETLDASAAVLDAHEYLYNDLNQRTRHTRADGSYWSYAYDDLGQVESAVRHNAVGAAVPGFGFGYAFDDIGNRTETTTNGRAATYTPNNLNEYDERQVPRALDIRGTAVSGSTLTVNGNAATRQDEIFHHALDLSAGGNSAQQVDVLVTASLPDGGDNNAPRVADAEKSEYLPPNPEVFVHDDDGNLTADGKWSYTWDAENRLIGMETLPVAVTAGAEKLKLEFAYDSQGRRFSKTVSTWNGSTGNWETKEATKFLYDGWNLIYEITDLQNASVAEKSYVWGNDLSGTMQGAGGVGGLLMAIHARKGIYYPAFDGNGNVVAYYDGDSGESIAEFEYGPFGEPIRATGPKADKFRFRFSSKYDDAETGLLYYGYRYYAPQTGRWLSRDPIGERGGLSLYGMVGNDPVNFWDYLGLKLCRIKLYFGHGATAGNPSFQLDRASDFLDELAKNDADYAKALAEWQRIGRSIAEADRERHQQRKPVNLNDSLYCGIGGCQPQVSNALIPSQDRAIRDLSIFDPFYAQNIDQVPGYIQDLIDSGKVLPRDMIMEKSVISNALTAMAQEAFKNACKDGCTEVQFSFYGQSDTEPVLRRNSDGTFTQLGVPPQGPTSISAQDGRFRKPIDPVKCPCAE